MKNSAGEGGQGLLGSAGEGMNVGVWRDLQVKRCWGLKGFAGEGVQGLLVRGVVAAEPHR